MTRDAHAWQYKLMPPRVRFEIIPIPSKGKKVLVPKGFSQLPEGATITITCSESIGIPGTLDTTEEVIKRGYRAVPHIPARMVESKCHLIDIVSRLESLGVKDIFVPGGDATPPHGEFSSALEMLRIFRALPSSVIRVGITGYPQGHYDISSDVLKSALLAKQPYADYIVTQVSENFSSILRWISDIRESGVTLPVYVGVIGQVERKRLWKIARSFGIRKTSWFLRHNPIILRRMLAPEVYTSERIIKNIAFLKGVQGIHLTPFNNIEKTENWRKNFIS